MTLDECEVWWADPADLSVHHHLLDPVERGRLTTLVRDADRARQAGGAVLLRLAAAELAGVEPSAVVVERTCPDCDRPHGRPRLPGLGLYASISHSGERVVVALTRSAPVGVDVELVAPIRTADLVSSVLGAGEHASDTEAFYRYWTRKESVVKATGEGLRASLVEVHVTGAGEPPRLISYPGSSTLVSSMADLEPGDGYVAALTVLHPGPLRITQRWLPATAAASG